MPSAKPPAGAVLVDPGDSVQQALDSLPGGGGWVVLAEGIHRLAAPLKIPSGATLAGQGFNSILWLDPKQTGPAIVNAETGLYNVTLRDLVIERRHGERPSHRSEHRPPAPIAVRGPQCAGIELISEFPHETRNLRLERVVVRNCTATGVRLFRAHDVVIRDCDFSDNGGSVPPGAGAHNNLTIERSDGCEITGSILSTSSSGSGVELLTCSKLIISGSETVRNSQCGIHVVDCDDVRIEGNLAEGNVRGGIIIEADKQGCQRLEVRDNRARNNGGYGIEISATGDAIIRDNTAGANGRPSQRGVTVPRGP